MKKVSVKFNRAGKWAISITKQIKVVADQVINDLPLEFAYIVVDAGRGEIVERKEPEAVEVNRTDGGGVVTTLLFSPSELSSLAMDSLRGIGNKFDVTSNSKASLVEKIIGAQVYIRDYLDSISDEDLVAIATISGVDISVLHDEDNLTQYDTEYLVKEILTAKGNE